jgi:hypothetical protein
VRAARRRSPKHLCNDRPCTACSEAMAGGAAHGSSLNMCPALGPGLVPDPAPAPAHGQTRGKTALRRFRWLERAEDEGEGLKEGTQAGLGTMARLGAGLEAGPRAGPVAGTVEEGPGAGTAEEGPGAGCGAELAYAAGESWDSHVTRVAGVVCARLSPPRSRVLVRVWTGPLHFYSVRYDAADPGVSGVYSEVWCPSQRRATRIVHCGRVGEREHPLMQELVDRFLFHFQECGPGDGGYYSNVGLTCGALSSATPFCASARTLTHDAHEFGFFAGTSAGRDAFAATCGNPDPPAAHVYTLPRVPA